MKPQIVNAIPQLQNTVWMKLRWDRLNYFKRYAWIQFLHVKIRVPHDVFEASYYGVETE